jgi:hypothetical protein
VRTGPLAAALASGLAAAGLAAAAEPPTAVHLATVGAAARNVGITISTRTALHCGRPLGTIAVTLPAAARVPQSIPPVDVRVNGKPAGAAATDGKTITVAAARPSGVMCDSIAIGAMTVAISGRAGVGSPPKPDRYTYTVTRSGRRWTTTIRIR